MQPQKLLPESRPHTNTSRKISLTDQETSVVSEARRSIDSRRASDVLHEAGIMHTTVAKRVHKVGPWAQSRSGIQWVQFEPMLFELLSVALQD